MAIYSKHFFERLNYFSYLNQSNNLLPQEGLKSNDLL